MIMHQHTADNLRNLISAAAAAGDTKTAQQSRDALYGDTRALSYLVNSGSLADVCADACQPDGNGYNPQNG